MTTSITQSADPHTADGVFRSHAAGICNLARRMVDNDVDAEDVTQDVFVQVVRKLGTFRGDARLTTWLHRVTVNAALLARQKRAARQKRETVVDGDVLRVVASGPGLRPTGAPDGSVLAAEQREIIENAIANLPTLFRAVYVLADVEGVPNANVADTLGLSVAAVKSRLYRARKRMRKVLSPVFECVR